MLRNDRIYHFMLNVRSFSLQITRETLKVADKQKSGKLKQINQYLIIRKIGDGRSAKVYLGLNTQNSQFVAIKAPKKFGSIHNNSGKVIGSQLANGDNKIHMSVPYLAQFEREVSLIRRLNKSNHPSIIKIIQVLYSKSIDRAYIIFEWADCGSLKTSIDQKYTFSDSELALIFRQILEGLQYVHSQGIAHEDIKPSNLLIFSDGKVKISDFGIGHSFESADTVIGSPAYQAPEVIDDSLPEDEFLDPSKEDVWSLGVSLFEAKFHVLPYCGETFFEIANCIRQNELHFPSAISDNLKDVLLKMLEVDPNKRASIDDLLSHPFFDVSNCSPLKLPVTNPNFFDTNSDVEKIDAVEYTEGSSLPYLSSSLNPDTFPIHNDYDISSEIQSFQIRQQQC